MNVPPNITQTPASINVRIGVLQIMDIYIYDENNNIRNISIISYPSGRTNKTESLPVLLSVSLAGQVKLSWTPESSDITSFSVLITDQLGITSIWNANVLVCNCSESLYEQCNFLNTSQISGILYIIFLNYKVNRIKLK